MATVFDFEVTDNKGKNVPLAKYEGSVLLIVNTATKCGLAPQYEGLQNLYEKYQDQNFYVLDFPSNQFLQTPHDNEEIDAFCTANYKTTFPRFDKINVNGETALPLYKFLKQQKGGAITDAIKWNFTKFLLNRNGQVVKRFGPTVEPSKIEEDIQALL